jgi:hypothetical protein
MQRGLTLAVTMAVALPGITFAGEPNWVMLAGNDASVEFLDINSLAIRAGHLTAWVLTNYTTPQTNGANESFQSVKALGIYDCAADRSGPVELIVYSEESGRGEVVTSEWIKPAAIQLSYTVPGSAGHRKIELVCSLWAQSHPPIQRAAKPKSAAQQTSQTAAL